MSSLSPNLEMCVHFLHSVTIYNDSAFYFTEIIVLISWAGTPTQIRVGWVAVAGEGGCMMGQYVLFMSKSRNIHVYFIYQVVTICSDSASYFLEMSILIICVGTLTQIRLGLGCITFPCIGPRSAFLM